MSSPVTPELRSEIAPTGIAPDIGRELARRLGVPLAFVRYRSPGELVDAAASGVWDVGLVGADPLRATEIVFTPAYCELDATYLVRADSPIRAIEDVDRPGMRIAIAEKTAYDMYLRGALLHATLHRVPGVEGSYQLFVSEHLDALAGLKVVLLDYQERHPGLRLLEGRFTAIQQAIGTPIRRTAAAAYLESFVQDLRAGLAARLIATHGVRGVTVPTA